MTCRLFLAAVVVATTSALVPPTRPLQRAGSLQPPSTRPIADARPAATAIATAWIPTAALADFGTWISGLSTQDYVALGVLAFLVIFVIPSLVGDILENQADPAAAIAKKQQKLKDLEDKYSFLVGDAPAPAPAPAADAPPADEFTQRKAAADAAASDEADALLASVKAMTNKD